MEDVESIAVSVETIVEKNPVYTIGAAVVIVVITAILAHLMTRLLRRLMRRDDLEMPSASIIVNVMRAIIWALGLSFMLSSCFKVDVTAAIAAAGIVGIVISLGLKDTMSNIIGGLSITFLHLVEPGDYIGVNGVEGIVEDVNWRQTVIRDINGNQHIVPNATINVATVMKIDEAALVVVPFVVNNDGDEMDAMAATIEKRAAEALAGRFPLKRQPWVLFTGITDYGMNGKVRFILARPEGKREAVDAVVRAIAPLTRQNAEDIL